MMDIAQLQAKAPYYGEREIWANDQDQNVAEIISAIRKNHGLDREWYDKNSKEFWRGNVKDSAKMLFDFLKKYIRYAVEPEKDQTVKTPGRLLHDRHGDCKHYALFTCGMVDALSRKGYPIQCRYRFVSDYPDSEVHHVFAVVSDPQTKTEYWVDPVIDGFNNRPVFYNQKDYCMVSRLSGTMNGTISRDVAIVAGQISRENPFRNKDEIAQFLARHGKSANNFRSADELKLFIIEKLRGHIRGVGKHNKKHANFLKGIAHGLAVNAQNVAHGIKVDAENAKTLALKVSLAAARAPYLGLLDINAFNMAHRMRDTLVNPKSRGRMLQGWKNLGGDEKALINATNNGWREYLKHHGGYNAARDHISGYGNSRIGVVQIPAMLAMAAGIIAALEKFVNSDAPKEAQPMAAATQQGTQDIAKKVHHAVTNSANPANSVTTMAQADSSLGAMNISTGVSSDGTPTITVNSASHPALNNAGQPPAPGSGADTSQDIPGGGPVASQNMDPSAVTPDQTADMTAVTPDQGADTTGKKGKKGKTKEGGGIETILAEVEKFAQDHKEGLLIGGAALVGYNLWTHRKKRR